MNRYANVAIAVLCFGLVLAAAGLGYGLQGVKVAPDTASCGSGFSYTASADLTDTGGETCAQVQSSRQATTWGLLAGGILAVVLAGIVAACGTTPNRPASAVTQAGQVEQT